MQRAPVDLKPLIESAIDAGAAPISVMPGLVPGIHVLAERAMSKNVDGRDKPGHDDAIGALTQRTGASWLSRNAVMKPGICGS
jgi:hypothetical protein